MATPASPVLSMTGFAACEHRIDGGTLLIDCRAVNHRYLELHLKIDEPLRAFEGMVREQLQAKLGRGKVECRIHLKLDPAQTSQVGLNTTTIAQIAAAMQQLQVHFPQARMPSLVELYQLPGVVQTVSLDVEGLQATLNSALAHTISELIAARQREGEKLKQVMLEKLAQVRALVVQVQPMMPSLISQYQEKLTAKLREAMQADDERVRQEIVLFAQRIDIDEELARLQSHMAEVARLLAAGGSVGKKLDFLMQEMNREANTLGSKSVAIETTQISMQLKVLIEQMREQIQNLE